MMRRKRDLGEQGPPRRHGKWDILKGSLSSVPSIEETGLDTLLYGEGLPFLAPQERLKKMASTPLESSQKALSDLIGKASIDAFPNPENTAKEDVRKRRHQLSIDGLSNQFSIHSAKVGGDHLSASYGKRNDSRNSGKLSNAPEEEGKSTKSMFPKVERDLEFREGKGSCADKESQSLTKYESMVLQREGSVRFRGFGGGRELSSSQISVANTRLSGIEEDDLELADSESETLLSISSSDPGDINMLKQLASSGLEARNRWRRVKHSLRFAHLMSKSIRSGGSGDFLEHAEEEKTTQESNSGGDDDCHRAGAAANEGAKGKGRFRAKGRKGMEGILVKQKKSMIKVVQDFYVACLKLPIVYFLVGVFFAPIALGLLFTPIYLLDTGGLSFDGVTLAEVRIIVGRVAAAKNSLSALANVFLYALSLSTTLGGSRVAALSPFCICIANLNTLMGQFLFVFLSGAVFARMSQPSKPIRCSKKAIIRPDDFISTASDASKEKYKLRAFLVFARVFAVRLVLTGPPPCELVDAKIRLTFRINVKLPSGSLFFSMQDLDLVRPEVSYLRYGITVRHIIDHKSPVHGHTMESLQDGDASFSLTIMGLERASMQPIFHLEDYFVYDGDVAWDADYVDFVHINSNGLRVLDHSKIDLIKLAKVL